ncbi:MAG: PAS domain-containing protein [Flavitalea sp.]
MNKNQMRQDELPKSEISNTLHQLAFDNSLQANIISIVSSGEIISANHAACKLLGYTNSELLTKTPIDIFRIKERSFKKMLRERKEEKQSTAYITVIHKNGDDIPCEMSSAIFMEDGIEKLITTLSNMSDWILKQNERDQKKGMQVAANVLFTKSKQEAIDIRKEKIVSDNIKIALEKSDAKLEEYNELIKHIGKTSYDVMWDWNVTSGEIYVGDSVEELFGYRLKNNRMRFADFTNCLDPHDNDIVKSKLSAVLESIDKTWNDSFLLKRSDGSFANTTSRASIIRDEKGKAIRLVGAIHDISRLQELESSMSNQISIQEEHKGKFLLTAKLSFSVIWDWNVNTNEIFMGEGYEELFGYSSNIITDWQSRIHPEDIETVKQSLQTAISSSATQWQHAYRFIRADGTIARLFDRASIFRNTDGTAYRMIGVMQDLSRQKEQNLAGIDLLKNRKNLLVEKIKNVILDLIHYTDERLQTNFSDYLTSQLQYDYTYLANIFSEVEGMPIQQFIILQKIERVKELIVSGEVKLTEIAARLHYSSVAHLSNQFKKITGFTPSQYRSQHHPSVNTLR